jgi:hypothetical protein
MDYKIGDLEKGDWFWFNHHMYVVLKHYQTLTDVIEFDNANGKLVGLRKMDKRITVDFAGKDFIEASTFYHD